jgi:hypothetical protein
VCAMGGNRGATAVTALTRDFLPKSSIVTGENSSDGDSVTASLSPVKPFCYET